MVLGDFAGVVEGFVSEAVLFRGGWCPALVFCAGVGLASVRFPFEVVRCGPAFVTVRFPSAAVNVPARIAGFTVATERPCERVMR